VFYLFRPKRRRVRRIKLAWMRPAVLASLLAGLSSLGGLMSETSLPSVSAEPQMVQPAGAQPQPIHQEPPLEQPLRMIAEARQFNSRVKDYQGILISQEFVNGKLMPEEIMQLSFRREPFSVYMKWLGPKDMAGQEVCYVQGKYQNQMRVLAASGWGRGFGWISIATNDPRVKQHSRHQITETGIMNLIDRCDKGWQEERTMNKTKVQIAEYEYNQRRCTRVETIHTDRDARFYCYRSVVYFDKETKLPIRMECYDWPRVGGRPEGELLECFSYINLQFNVNLPDSVFNH
jgi:hypothetical protein